MNTQSKTLEREKLHSHLENILGYWSSLSDVSNGGCIGQVDYNEKRIADADKGAVLHARILWTFSAAYSYTQNEKHLDTANQTYTYLESTFRNKQTEGVYWSVNYLGEPKETKNQIYALAFVIYGLTEYYKVSRNKEAIEWAKILYQQIEKYSYDQVHEGYLEAFTHDWILIDDLRLSEKDANEKKTMNTHLHIVEAYANLYTVWPDARLKEVIQKLLYTIDVYFIDKKKKHLKLFFDEYWNEKPDVISYGHDVEAAWLLLWCAEIIQDVHLIELYKSNAILLADGAMEGLDHDGGLWYEFDPTHNHMIKEKHWWPQAEFWIGMHCAYELTRDHKYFEALLQNYAFTEQYLLDSTHGEWFWGIYDDYSHIEKDKAGFWKCPYHNSRACLELIRRIDS